MRWQRHPTRRVALCLIAAGSLLVACGDGPGIYTPTCVTPAPEHIAFGTFAAITGTTAYVLSSDLREEYCSPYLSEWTLQKDTWTFTDHTLLPLVRPGVPAIPIFATMDDDGALWMSDRRGLRLIRYYRGEFTSLAAGFAPARFVLDLPWIYAADATTASLYVLHQDGRQPQQYDTESGRRASHLILAGPWVLVSQETSGFVSRWRRDNQTYDSPITPFLGRQDFAPKDFVVDPVSQDIFALMTDRNTVIRLAAKADYELVDESPRLRRPVHIRYDDHLYVQDVDLGVLQFTSGLKQFVVERGSPKLPLHTWAYARDVPDIGLRLTDERIRTW